MFELECTNKKNILENYNLKKKQIHINAVTTLQPQFELLRRKPIRTKTSQV